MQKGVFICFFHTLFPPPTHSLTHSPGSRPHTSSSLLSQLEEVCRCEGVLVEREGELAKVAAELEQVQKVAAK